MLIVFACRGEKYNNKYNCLLKQELFMTVQIRICTYCKWHLSSHSLLFVIHVFINIFFTLTLGCCIFHHFHWEVLSLDSLIFTPVQWMIVLNSYTFFGLTSNFLCTCAANWFKLVSDYCIFLFFNIKLQSNQLPLIL